MKSIKTLESMGFKHWTKYGKDRMYIDAKTVFDMEIDYYNSGNIRDAKKSGEDISNSRARKLLNMKIYIDLADGSIHADHAWYEEDKTEAIEKVEAMIADDEEETEEAEEAEEAEEIEEAETAKNYKSAYQYMASKAREAEEKAAKAWAYVMESVEEAYKGAPENFTAENTAPEILEDMHRQVMEQS